MAALAGFRASVPTASIAPAATRALPALPRPTHIAGGPCALFINRSCPTFTRQRRC